MLKDAALILAGYLLGSIPFAYLITKVATGKDIRYEGEGNVGTRNVLHVVGRKAAFLTLLGDMGKGAAANLLAQHWGSGELALWLTGFAAMLGHGFPIWLKWRGGKGLATAGGFLVPMWPLSILGAAIIFIIARLLIPDFNLAFAVTGVAIPLLTLWEGNDLYGVLGVILLFSIAGLKKIVDLPHERAMRAKSGWIEGLRLRRRNN